METKGLFAREEGVIAAAKERMQQPFATPGDEETFAKLLKDYEKLLKTTWRFMRLSDRNEAQLNKSIGRERVTAQELNEKNKELENISAMLSKYLSPQVYNSIFAGNHAVELASRRKKLTVFFSDLHGFTNFADRMESEDLTDIINHYLTEMADVALQYGATIDKYMGDAVMVFFGDPESRGAMEDAVACVQMALAMQKRIEKLSEIWRSRGIDQQLRSRIGIHTGYCTVGNFGSADRMDYTIVGGNVNLASRLEKDAPPGGVLISYETYALVKDHIHCEAQGEIRPRGLAYPVDTYLAIRAINPDDAKADQVSVELPNMQLNANLAAMDTEEISEVRGVLADLLNKLKKS